MDNKISFFNLNQETSTQLKGLAIIFVLLGHLGYIFFAGAWGVNLFLILSGYGVYLSYSKNGLKDFFTKKAIKVYLPYLIYAIIMVCYYLYTNHFVFSRKIVLATLLGLDINANLDKSMWYISFIFFEYFLFFVTATFANKVSKIISKEKFIFFTIIILSVLFMKFFDFNLLWHVESGVTFYVFAFPIGVLLAIIKDWKVNKNFRELLFVFASIVCFIITICLYKNCNTFFQYFIFALAIPGLIILISQILKKFNSNKILLFFGEYSFYIYLWEWFLLNMKDSWFAQFKYTIIINIVYVLLCVVISYFYKKAIIDPITEQFEKIVFATKKRLPLM
jgi:peptidoglycan/LPS O-acetylase OafA/YrhL